MKDEIKEIEEWLRDISTPTGLSYSGDRTLSNSMVDYIMNYITNLQEENYTLDKENKYLDNELGKYKNVIDKIKEYAGELRLFDNESVEFEISNNILELLEEVE